MVILMVFNFAFPMTPGFVLRTSISNTSILCNEFRENIDCRRLEIMRLFVGLFISNNWGNEMTDLLGPVGIFPGVTEGVIISVKKNFYLYYRTRTK